MAKVKTPEPENSDTLQPETSTYSVHTNDGIVSVEAKNIDEAIKKVAKEQERG